MGNQLKNRLAEGRIAFGASVQFACSEMVELIGRAGYDFAWIDCEHGTYGFETAVQMIRAAEAYGITPIIRVPDHTPSFITRCLDAGAVGIIAPNVSTAGQAERIVAAAKYQDDGVPGKRGACPTIRAGGHQIVNWPEHVAKANEDTLVWLLVEDVEGARNFDEIVTVPGVDAIMLGSFDLAQSMGFSGRPDHPDVVASIDTMVSRCKAKGIDFVAVVFDTDMDRLAAKQRAWIERGCRILATANDKRIMGSALVRIREAANRAAGEKS